MGKPARVAGAGIVTAETHEINRQSRRVPVSLGEPQSAYFPISPAGFPLVFAALDSPLPKARRAGILQVMSTRLTALLLIVSVVVLRLAVGADSALAGFAPFVALVLAAAMLCPRPVLAFAPLAAFLISDILLNAMHGHTLLHPYLLITAVLYGGLFLFGRPLHRAARPALPYLGATVAGVVAFQILGNSAAWLMDPGYAKSFAGFVQANTTGLPGFPPSWMFLLKSLVGNLAFGALFLLAARRASPAVGQAEARAAA